MSQLSPIFFVAASGETGPSTDWSTPNLCGPDQNPELIPGHPEPIPGHQESDSQLKKSDKAFNQRGIKIKNVPFSND